MAGIRSWRNRPITDEVGHKSLERRVGCALLVAAIISTCCVKCDAAANPDVRANRGASVSDFVAGRVVEIGHLGVGGVLKTGSPNVNSLAELTQAGSTVPSAGHEMAENPESDANNKCGCVFEIIVHQALLIGGLLIGWGVSMWREEATSVDRCKDSTLSDITDEE